MDNPVDKPVRTIDLVNDLQAQVNQLKEQVAIILTKLNVVTPVNNPIPPIKPKSRFS